MVAVSIQTVRLTVGTAVAAFVLLLERPVEAQPAPSCAQAAVDAEITAANNDRRAGRALPAIDRLRALQERCPSPRTLAQLALAEQGASRWRDAYLRLREVLASADPWVAQRRSALETARREVAEHLPRLSPQCNVPGAVLLVDGETVGPLPLAEPRVLPTGTGVLEVRAAGYVAQRRAVSVAEENVFREMFTLVQEPTAPTPTAAPTPPLATQVGGTSGGALRPLGITGVVLGAALLGVGAVGIVLQRSYVASFTDQNCFLSNGNPAGGAGCATDYDAGRTMEAMSIGGFVAGGVLAAAGVTLLLLDRGRAHRTSHVACGVGVGAFECVGAF